MQITVPEDFEVFAREQAATGVVSSPEEAVTSALRAHLDDVRGLRALLDPALASLDRGEGIDGPSFMRELIEETETLEAAQIRSET